MSGGRIPTPLQSGILCEACRGTGVDAAATRRMSRSETGSYLMCRACHGNGLDPAGYFRWGGHKPL